MSVVERIDWDAWRTNYADMSFAEHQAFNARCLDLHPVQRSYQWDVCYAFLWAREKKTRTVVEIGGWDGGLADVMLRRFPWIESWTNYDITPDVPQVCDDPRYTVEVLDDWPWRRKVSGDAVIASHVFEHMRMYEIECLLTEWDVASVYVDCPISPGMTTWRGYEGSHILAVGSTEFLFRLNELGYQATYKNQDGGLIAYLDRVGV